MKRLLIFLIPLLVLTSCHTNRQAQTLPPAPIVLNNSDSVRVETIIKTEYVPVRVEVPVPQQSVSNIVFETDTSHIETDVAVSDAWITPEGTLFHNLVNKDVKLSGEAYVPQTSTENNNEAVRTKEIPAPQPYPVYVEKSLSKSEQFKLSAFWYLVGTALVAGAYIFRKPFLKLIRKIIG